MEIRKIDSEEIEKLKQLNEDHFNDVKSKRISPSKLQQTFVAFANSDGGDLYIGIEDKKVSGERINGFDSQEEANQIISTLLEDTEPSVENIDLEFLETSIYGFILHISIPKSPKVHYTANGDCYIRINAEKRKIKGERITQLSYSKGVMQYEKRAVENLEIEDIVESPYLKDYMKRVETNLAEEVFLRKQRLLTKKDGERFPNIGCALLFDEEPQATLDTRCSIKVYRLNTTSSEYHRSQLEEMPKTITGPLENIILGVIDQVRKYLDDVSYNVGDKLVKMEYPAEALKEVLVNAVIHRDYSLNDDIHVKIYDNRIEIHSPGKLPGYMTIENLYSDRFSRNPNVVRMLHNLPDPVNHDIGEGLDTVKNELKRKGLVAPIFEEKENSFIVTIKHQKIASVEDIAIKYLEEHPGEYITNKLIRQLSGEEDMQKVKKSLQKLRKLKKIEPVDKKASAFNYKYKLVEK